MKVRIIYFYFMIIISSLMIYKIINKIIATDKIYALIGALIIIIVWVFCLIFIFIRLIKEPVNKKLINIFNVLTIFFSILPFIASFFIIKNVVRGDLNFPLDYLSVVIIADVLFFVNISFAVRDI